MWQSYGIVTELQIGQFWTFGPAICARFLLSGTSGARYEREHMFYLPIAVIRAAITAALPRLRGDLAKVDRWAALFCGWQATSKGGTIITAPTTGTASNVARRAWKNTAALKGTVSVPLARWHVGDLMVKVSTATPTTASLRIATTQAVDKIVAALPDALGTMVLDADPQAAVSVDPHGDGIIVTAYMLERGEVRPGG